MQMRMNISEISGFGLWIEEPVPFSVRVNGF